MPVVVYSRMTHTHKRAFLGFFALSLLHVGVSTFTLRDTQLVGRYVILGNSQSIFSEIFKEVV